MKADRRLTSALFLMAALGLAPGCEEGGALNPLPKPDSGSAGKGGAGNDAAAEGGGGTAGDGGASGQAGGDASAGAPGDAADDGGERDAAFDTTPG